MRPTGERAREAIFNILAHGADPLDIEGVRVLDLFAGTGALGLEAVSRGARFCLFVDDHAESRGLIRRNAEALEATGMTRIFGRDATKLGAAGRFGQFHLLFADPPYGRGLAGQALASARSGGWLADGAVAVVEEAADAEIGLPDGFAETGRRTYGGTQVLFARTA